MTSPDPPVRPAAGAPARWRKNIAVIGSASCPEPIAARAREVGAMIARAGFNLLSGGRGGVMEAASAGFAAARGAGCCVGILPEADASAANPYLDVALGTGLGLARNVLVAQGADAVVVIAGQSGTLSELALAWQFGKPCAALCGTGGVADAYAGRALDDRRADVVTPLADAAALARWLAALADEGAPRAR